MSSSSQVVPITLDVLVQNEFTVFLFCPLTSQGKEWMECARLDGLTEEPC